MATAERDTTSLGVTKAAMPPDLIVQVPPGAPAKELSYQEAIREALREEMLRDPSVFLLGEDIGTRRSLWGDQDSVRPIWPRAGAQHPYF